MSLRSEKLARYIRKQRVSDNQLDQPDDKHLLDKGFSLLKDDLAREFRKQISDVNHEPDCIGTLGSCFGSRDSRVFIIGEEDKGLSVEFDVDKRTAEIKGKEPVKFYYFIQVTPAKDGAKLCYLGGQNRADLAHVTGKLDAIVEQALFALFGVEA
jgi:hypothetical protein